MARLPVLILSAAALTAATCNKSERPSAPLVAPAPAPADAGLPDMPKAAVAAPGNPEALLTDVPGLDFSVLSPAARRELATVMNDEFCYCGCPHTLGACLKQHGGCKHAQRMALLAASAAAEGTAAPEIIVSLSKYYLSFGEPRAVFKPDPRQCRGPADAKVTLVEFSDFECPFCAAARPMLEAVAQKNPAVRLCYMPFPLSGHPNAVVTGQAVLWARDLGKFWEMHDLLFENQQRLSPAVVKQLAGKLGLREAELQKVFDSGKYTDELNASKDQGRVAGVDSTPSVYVNGRKLALPLGPEILRHTVEDELEWASHQGAWAD